MQLVARDNEPTVDIGHPLLQGGLLHLWLVEGISDDSTEGVLNMSELKPSWRKSPASVGYQYAWGDGYRLQASASAQSDRVDLHLRFINGSERDLRNAKADPCLQFKDAPVFRDAAGERSLLFGKDGVMRVCDTRRYTFPGWWRNVQCYAVEGADVQTREGFKVPYRGTMQGRWGVSPDQVAHGLIAAERQDGKAVIGFAFEKSRFVSKNYNDSHHCIHSTPYFGNLGKAEEREVRGRIWFVAGSSDDLLRLHADWMAEMVNAESRKTANRPAGGDA